MQPDLAEVDCELDGVLKLVASRWTPHVLWVLLTNGPTRFGALRRSIPGISTRVLTERLRSLEAAGFVHREYVPTIPPEVTYSLTHRGNDLRDTLSAMKALAQRWSSEDG
jgi:DNA-binding HxlR family transcriptional regulator